MYNLLKYLGCAAKQVIILLALFALLASAAVTLAQDVRLARVAICTGGGVGASEAGQIKYLVGLVVADPSSNEDYGCSGGFLGGGIPAPPSTCCSLMADINHDGSGPDIADLVSLVNYMFAGGDTPPCMEETDVNGDGSGPDIADLVSLVNYMFAGGPAPVPCGTASAPRLVQYSRQSELMYRHPGGLTVVSLESRVALRGLQVELEGAGARDVVKLTDDAVDLVAGIKPGSVKAGILDLDGAGLLAAGRQDLFLLEGEYDITSAMAVDADGRTVYLTAGKGAEVPDNYALDPNYPNPFNPSTTIGFSLPEASPVRLEIYNLLGQQVTILVDGTLDAGHHEVVWNGSDAAGNPAASGIYFYRLTAARYLQSRKMMLLK